MIFESFCVLQVTQEALAKFQSSQLESTQAGIEHEESLLNESAARESSLNTQVKRAREIGGTLKINLDQF